MKRLATVAALGAVVLTTAAALPANAAGGKEKTHVSFVAIVTIGDDYSYEGTIESKKKCADKRKVIVYRKQAGKDEKIGATKANGPAGVWNVLHPDDANGTYYAKAPQTSECEGDKSGKLNIKQG